MTLTYAEVLAAAMLLALVIYALLGGADFGAGLWDMLARGERAQRRRDLISGAIGPVWEANYVWLIIVLVLMFTGFPRAFSVIMTTLHIPITLMLVGIVIRGSAFTFRAYDNTPKASARWNRAFSIPSVATPVLLGMIIGAIASGRLPNSFENNPTDPSNWLAVFPFTVGLFTLAIFAFLAAVYLTLETDDEDLRDDFRKNALAAALVVGALAFVVYLLARIDAPLVFAELARSRWGFAVRMATGVAAMLAIVALWNRWYQAARVAAMVQCALILWGCGLAMRPYVVPPTITIANSSAPRATIVLLLWALAVGSLILVPSIYYMMRVFKGHTLRRRHPHGTMSP